MKSRLFSILLLTALLSARIAPAQSIDDKPAKALAIVEKAAPAETKPAETADAAAAAAATATPAAELASKPAEAAESTKDSETPQTAETPKEGIEQFELVFDRNIFDPTRTPPRPRDEGVREEPVYTPRPTPAPEPDTVDLIGVWITPQQQLALTQGSKSEYNGSLPNGADLGGWKIASVQTGQVELQKGEQKLVWLVGQRIKRPVGGEWELAGDAQPSGGGASFASGASSPGSSSGSAASGSAADLLQKMKERRKQEEAQQ